MCIRDSMNTFGLAPLILILPVLGLLFNGLFGRRFVDANRAGGERLTLSLIHI